MVLPSSSSSAGAGDDAAPAAPPPGDGRPPGDERPPWPLWIAPAGVVLGFMLATFGSIIVDAIAHARGASLSNPGPAASIISDIVFDLCFVAAALWLTRWQGRVRPADFGYRRIRWKTGITAVLVGAVGYYGVTAIFGALVKTNQTDKLPSDLGVTHSTAALIAASVFVCAIAPMAEEFFFRGFLWGTLRNIPVRAGRYDLGPWVASVLVALLFGLAHLGSAPAIYLGPLAFLGFVLCLMRWKTGSLYPCMALHSANNALALGINQLSWTVPAIVGLVVASWLVVGAVTGPLSGRAPQHA
jgi:membrane protease YdiL (CAAX protease family)